MRASGFTLLEMTFAFGLLVIAIMMTSMLVSGLDRHQSALWEDAIAESLAVSILERAIAESNFELTPPEGREVPVEKSTSGVEFLPNIKSVLSIRALPDDRGVVELQAQVSWRFSEVVPNGDVRTIRRTLRWRISQ